MPDLSSFATTEASSSAGAAGGEDLDDQRDGDRESCDSRESTSAWSTAYTTWPSTLQSTSSSIIMSLKRGGGDLSSLLLWSFLLLPAAPLILISLPFCLLMPKRVRLADGRLLAWQEFGVPQGSARHTLLVVHAPPLCRTAGFPGLSEAFFHQRSIRVISFDLPGTGFSDPLPLQATTTTASFASAVADDIKQLAQQLHIVPGLWIVGFGLGSPLAHAAAERLGQGLVAGLLLLGPPGVLNTGEGGDTNEEIRGRETGMHAGVEERRPGGQPEVVMSRQQAGGVWQLVQQSFRGRIASAVLRIVVPRVLVQSVVALLRTSPAVLKWIVTATSLRPISPRVVSLICDGLLGAVQQGDLPYLLNLLVLTLQPHNTQPCPANNPFFSGPVYTYKVFDEPSIAFPEGKDNLLKFEITIKPDEGYYLGGTFTFSFEVQPSYPHEAPKVKCKTKVYHPNIDLEGNVCLNILREDWKPVLSINSIVYGLQFLFLDPNPDDPLNHEAAEVLRTNPRQFDYNVKRSMAGGYVGGHTFPRCI
ncbi:unnamed protein product [Closterium sp. Naga37s-1]|nr:unnamed protein product [Closterium sp. Naga37s-1]